MARWLAAWLVVVVVSGVVRVWPSASAQEGGDLEATVAALATEVAELERDTLNLRWQVRLLEGDKINVVRVATGQRANRAPMPGEFQMFCDIALNSDDQTNPYNPAYVLRCR